MPGRTSRSVVRKYHGTVRGSDLHVDPDVQRSLNPKQVDKLENEWDEIFAGTLVISKRKDGSMWVVDGQHRCAAGLRKDGEMIFDAEIHEGLTLQQEADMFLALNKDRKPPHPFDNYHVSITAGKELEMRIEAEVASRGLMVAKTASANKVAAIEKLRSLANKDKARTGLISDTLEVCEAAWGRNAESWDNMIIFAVGTVIIKNRDVIEKKRLWTTLGKHEARQWKSASSRSTVSGGGSESRSNNLVDIIVTSYNKGLRTKGKMISA